MLYTQTLRFMRQLLAFFTYRSHWQPNTTTRHIIQSYPIHNSVQYKFMLRRTTLFIIKGAGSTTIFIELTESATNYIILLRIYIGPLFFWNFIGHQSRPNVMVLLCHILFIISVFGYLSYIVFPRHIGGTHAKADLTYSTNIYKHFVAYILDIFIHA